VARKVYFNGEFVSEQEARVSIFDSALMFGDMVFDMTRTYRQKPFRLRQHLERTYAGLRYLNIDCGLAIDEMERATLETLEQNLPALDGADAQIMHNISRGPLPMYRGVFGGSVRPTITISCWPYWWHLAAYGPLYRNGVRAVVPAQRSVPAHLIDPKVKNRSRIYYQVANIQAQRVDSSGWALLTDEQGLVTEGTGSNFFLLRKGKVYTPPGRNILLGITRGAVLDLLPSLSIPAVEQDFGLYEIINADEAFFTATSFGIMPCTSINGQPIGDGKPGVVTQKLIAAWSEMVGVDIIAQADDYAQKVKDREASETELQPAVASR
jgi:branched-chain amino acid aminotransferase